MTSLLFVCTGNTCRSPMAEALMRHMLQKAGIENVHVFSRGIAAREGSPMTREAIDTLAAQGIAGENHRAALLTAEDLEQADLVFVMEAAQAQWIERHFPRLAKKVALLKEFAGEVGDIADPIGGSRETYEKCKMDIQDALLSILSKLKTSEGSMP